jgi:cation diffusion facilitator family transporter
MTTLLLRLFVKNFQDISNSRTRSAIGKLSGIVGIACNLLLFVGKLLVGTLSHSVAITADAMNNLSDASGAMVTLLGFKLAGRPADEDHPYGHARYEYLTGLAVAVLVLFIGFELAKSSFLRILSPEPVVLSPLVIGILLASIGLKLWLCLFNRRLGSHIHSTALMAAAADCRNDCIATSAVLASGLMEEYFRIRVDGFMGLAVAVFILYSGICLARDTISPILGENAAPELRQQMADFLYAQPKVLGFHDLMVHDYGPGHRFATVHVEMDHREDPLFCHTLIDKMERVCLRNFGIHLVIHHDPVVTDDPGLTQMRDRILALLQSFDPRLTLHDFRMVKGYSMTNLVFDVALPPDLRGSEQDIRRQVEEELNAHSRVTYYAVITFDNGSF